MCTRSRSAVIKATYNTHCVMRGALKVAPTVAGGRRAICGLRVRGRRPTYNSTAQHRTEVLCTTVAEPWLHTNHAANCAIYLSPEAATAVGVSPRAHMIPNAITPVVCVHFTNPRIIHTSHFVPRKELITISFRPKSYLHFYSDIRYQTDSYPKAFGTRVALPWVG